MDTLAHRLKKARLLRELSQPALAKLAGVSQGTIGNIEAWIRGGSTSLAQLAHVLQVRYHWLRDGSSSSIAAIRAANGCRFLLPLSI